MKVKTPETTLNSGFRIYARGVHDATTRLQQQRSQEHASDSMLLLVAVGGLALLSWQLHENFEFLEKLKGKSS